jgi:quercetin dioxygenase-like cupin family protein
MNRTATATDQTTEPLWFLHNLALIHARSDQTNGTYSVVEITGAPGDTPPLHVHLHEETKRSTFWTANWAFTFRASRSRT